MAAELPQCVPFAPDFRVGDWLVEPSLDRLSRNGTVLRLRPQLTNLLVLLAQHAGRTVSKDEILARVWEGHFVAESGMTRCIAELRQALGDDAREPKVLETIPKRGYRLVAPVVFLDADSGVGREPAIPPDSKDEPPAAEPGPDSTVAPAAEPLTVPAAHGRGRYGLGWAVGSALAVTLVLAVTWGAGGWSRAPVLTERDRVLLADVRNTTGDAAFDHTLRLALAVQLGQAPFLHILPAGHVRSALTLMGRPHDQPVVGEVALELCRREGAAVLLAGSIARLGSHYAVGLEAVACRTGESIDRELVEVESKDGVLTALGTIVARLRRKLGESRASLDQYDVPIVRATTPSLDALKALSLGDLNRDHARPVEALTFYRRATELDPQFALAWARRGAAALNVGQEVADERFGGESEPVFAFSRAYELRDRVSEQERFYILAHYYRSIEGDLNKAVETYKTWRQAYPGSVVPPTNLASLYNTLGRYEEALPEAREAVRLAPYSSIATRVLVAAYLGANRVPEARQAMRDAANRGVGDLTWHELAFEMAFADNDATALAEHARWASRDPMATVAMTQHQALAALATGRLRESRRLWAEAAAAAAHARPGVGPAAVKALEAESEALLGDSRAARAAAEAAVAADRGPDTLLVAATALALCDDRARARELIDEAARRLETGIASKSVWRPVARALVEARPGQFDRALGLLGEAAPYERGSDFGLAPLGVRAWIELSAGHGRQAAAIFQELLDLRAVAPTSPWVAFARLGLARSLRDAGDVQGSRAAYDAVIDGMKNGDADAPLLVAARREGAALPLR